jgi:hypothetical protein
MAGHQTSATFSIRTVSIVQSTHHMPVSNLATAYPKQQLQVWSIKQYPYVCRILYFSRHEHSKLAYNKATGRSNTFNTLKTFYQFQRELYSMHSIVSDHTLIHYQNIHNNKNNDNRQLALHLYAAVDSITSDKKTDRK